MVVLALVAALALFLARRFLPSAVAPSGPSSGETLVASIRGEPRSFNRYTARDLTTVVITFLTQAGLVRVDHVTNRLEPELAESWERLPDNLTYRVHLRPGLRFSDGEPFSSDDVVFSFRAIYDEHSDSVLADTLQVLGKPLTVAAENATTVTIRFPSPFGPGLRLLDGVPMLPRHRLEASLLRGQFGSAWRAATAPSEIAGLGPFLLRRYDAGQRLVFDRNPHYWRREGGRPLPVVDHVVLEVVPDQSAEQLQLESGTIDLTQSELRPSDYVALARAADRGRMTLTDLGVGLDGDLFWFNLAASKAKDARREWLQQPAFRRAVAHAIDRDVFVSVVYLGAAVPGYTVVSPGNKEWYADTPAPRYDVGEARRLLASLHLSDPTGDGTLHDRDGAPVRFSLLTQKGNTSLERGAAVIRDSLAPLGIRVDVVELEVGALVQHLTRGDYDAAYFRLLTTDGDPALNPDFWLSSGSAHVWNPAQPHPATAWEQQIDALMEQLSTTTDPRGRHARFEDVQRIMSREMPAMCFAFPRLWVAMSARVTHATPAAFRPPVLWNPAVIEVGRNPSPR